MDFISLIVIFILVTLAFILTCWNAYKLGVKLGYKTGYDRGANDVLDKWKETL